MSVPIWVGGAAGGSAPNSSALTADGSHRYDARVEDLTVRELIDRLRAAGARSITIHLHDQPAQEQSSDQAEPNPKPKPPAQSDTYRRRYAAEILSAAGIKAERVQDLAARYSPDHIFRVVEAVRQAQTANPKSVRNAAGLIIEALARGWYSS